MAASNSARWLRNGNALLTAAWAVMLPIALLTGLKNSLPFIVAVSIYANFVGHASAWIAGRAEVASEENP